MQFLLLGHLSMSDAVLAPRSLTSEAGGNHPAFFCLAFVSFFNLEESSLALQVDVATYVLEDNKQKPGAF